MDSFRVVRYEIEMENPCYESKNILLRQRHRAAPGTVLVSKPTADLSKSCMLCKVHAFMVPTGWQQQAPLHCLCADVWTSCYADVQTFV